MQKFFIIPIIILVLVIGIRVVTKSQNGSTYTSSTNASGETFVQNHLYNFSCSTETSCTKIANVYMIHIDGIDVEMDIAFAQQCVEYKYKPELRNSYCDKLVEPGDMSSFSGNQRTISHILEFDNNPRPSDSLEQRREVAKQKILNS